MRKTLVAQTIFVISILTISMGIITGCKSLKNLNQKNSNDWVQSTYIDSVIIEMPRVQILSAELKLMLDTLIVEALKYEPLKGFPNYKPGITISTNRVPNNQIMLTIGKSYIFSYQFPEAKKNNPFYPNVYPIIPSKLGLSIYRGYQIDYLWTMKNFISGNDLRNPELIEIYQDSLKLTAYAPRIKETNEWVYMVMPNITLYCEIAGDKVIFQRFEYDDGGIKYIE